MWYVMLCLWERRSERVRGFFVASCTVSACLELSRGGVPPQISHLPHHLKRKNCAYYFPVHFFYPLQTPSISYNPKGWVGYGEYRPGISAFLFTWRDGDTSKPAIKLRKVLKRWWGGGKRHYIVGGDRGQGIGDRKPLSPSR